MNTSLLLADDSPTIAKILQMSLASEPYEIRSVLNADDAIRELQSNPPAFFLVDLTLPEKNGYEFARFIKKDPKLSKTRVVLLASAFEPVDEEEYAGCGADGLVKKPFDPSELRSTLKNLKDAPPKFPDGSKVTGSLSGFTVKPEATKNTDLSHLLSESGPQSGDADSILAGILGGSSPASAPEPAVPPSFENRREATIALDLSEQPSFQTQESVLDLSGSFSTPPGGIAIGDEATPPPSPLSIPTLTPTAPEAPLSANAQALAAFFDAEIQSKDIPPNPPSASPASPPPAENAKDSFDASLDSIEWATGPGESSLNAWSYSGPKGKPAAAAPPRRASETPSSTDQPPPTTPRSAASNEPPRGGPLAGESLMFDTGGSTFRFSEDYVNRISKAFTGGEHDHVPESAGAPFFPQKSDDSRPLAAPGKPAAEIGGGAWSDQDVARIEKIVREEVQMVVREVAEKIAWEVIPELAENLIRKELEKVLKELSQP